MRTGRARRAAGALAAGLLVVLAAVVWMPSPAQAGVITPLTNVYDQEVYGDFLVSGNTVLGCPPATPTCLTAASRATSGSNQNFAMTFTDVDGVPSTYDSSSATVTIPAGTRVRSAFLQWGGIKEGSFCEGGSIAGSAFPAGHTSTEPVQLTVGGAAPVSVAPGTYTSDTGPNVGSTSGSKYYAARADVTSAFSSLAAATTTTVTVANVFAAEGLACHGGWSVTVVYEAVNPTCTTLKRRIFVYNGHVRQGANDAPTTMTVSGFRVSDTPASAAVIAYEGDYGTTGDRLSINGTNIVEPGTGATSNFFISAADNASNPAYLNNFSTDAKKFTIPSTVVKVGDTSATLQTSTSGDAFMVQSVVLSIPVPNICVQKDVSPAVVHPGDTLTWTVTVTNPSSGSLTNVGVTDPVAPSCARNLGTIASGASTTFTCTSVAPTGVDSVTNVATATGTSSVGDTVSGYDEATARVLRPALTVDKSVDPAVVVAGQSVTYTIKVTNSGNAALDHVAVDDDRLAACDRADLGTLAPGASTSYTCSTTIDADTTNTATATGTDELGRQVTATDDAFVDVVAPAIAIRKTASPTVVRAGDPVTFTITVTNTGDAGLTGVAVDDVDVDLCDRSIGALAAGASTTYTCTLPALSSSLTNTANVRGTPPAGPAVTATDAATVTVVHPSLAVAKSASPSVVREGDTITWSFSVTNNGDADLTNVRTSDSMPGAPPGCPRTFGTLAVGESQSWSCTTTAGTADVTNTVSATGTPPVGPDVTSSATATVDVVHPAVTIAKSTKTDVVRVGDTVTWTIAVTNSGDVTLHAVEVTDPGAPGCATTLGDVGAGAVRTYTCTSLADAGGALTNTATVTGQPDVGSAVTDQASATVQVDDPALSVRKTGPTGPVRAGDPVTFTITVTNTGNVVLDPVSVDDAATPACARTSLGALAPGDSTTYTCTTAAPVGDFTNTAVVTGTPPFGAEVKASDSAPVDVVHPSIALAKSTTSTHVEAGQPVTFSLTVTNDGDVDLTGVHVSDQLFPDCVRDFAVLAPGESRTWSCSGPAPADDVTNVAAARGTPPVGADVTADAQAPVGIDKPALQIAKTATPATAHAGDAVTFTITVRNTGNVDLTDVRVADASYPTCDRTVGSLAVDAVETFTCTVAAGSDDIANTATATGTSPAGSHPSATSDTAQVDVVHPALTVAKTASPTAVRPGDTVTFTIEVTNSGDVPLAAVTVDDDVHPACDQPVGALAAGAHATVTCTAVAGDAGETDTAIAAGTDALGRTVSATDDAAYVVQHPAVAITKTASPTTVRIGDPVTYTITVTNTGDVDLATVAVDDAQVEDCDRLVGTLAAGASTTYTCTLAAASTDLTNHATVTGTPPVGAAVSDTAQASIDVVNPSLAVTKSASPATVRAGDEVTWSFTLTNNGDVPLTGVTTSDSMAGAPAGCAPSYDDLGVGETRSWSCTTTAGTDDIANTVTASADAPAGGPVTDTATARVDVVHPAITVLKTTDVDTVRAGDTVTWTVTVVDSGDVTLHQVTVTDAAVPGCARTVGDLAAGASQSWTCTSVASSGGPLTNTATATGQPDVGPAVEDSASATAQVDDPSIAVTKTGPSGPVREGDAVTFTITVTNTGNVTLQPVSVDDAADPACSRDDLGVLAAGASTSYTCDVTAPADDWTDTAVATGTPPRGADVKDTGSAAVDVVHPSIALAKSTTSTHVEAGDPVTFTLTVTNDGDVTLTDIHVADDAFPDCVHDVATLAAGASRTWTCTGPAPAYDMLNEAHATATAPVGPAVSADAQAQVGVDRPALEVTKVADREVAQPGDPITFTITVTNTGNVALTDVTVTDASYPMCSRSVGPLDAGASTSFTCTVTATAADVTNTATATADAPTGTTAADSSPPATVTGVAPAISVTKSARPAVVRRAGTVTFTIVVRNSGNVALGQVRVNDTVDDACDAALGTLAPGASRTVTCSRTAGADGATDTAVATGTAVLPCPGDACPAGATVSATDSASYDVRGAQAAPQPPATSSGTSATVLPNTGSPVHLWQVLLGAGLVVAGVVLVTRRQRPPR